MEFANGRKEIIYLINRFYNFLYQTVGNLQECLGRETEENTNKKSKNNLKFYSLLSVLLA